jgi:hypothetical protein
VDKPRWLICFTGLFAAATPGRSESVELEWNFKLPGKELRHATEANMPLALLEIS